MSGFMRTLAAVGLGLLIGGCTTYKEPDASMAPAVLKGKEGCIIEEIDGQTTGNALGKVSAGTAIGSFGGNEVRVLAGMHHVMVQRTISNGTWTHNFRIECLANHTYTIEPKTLYGGQLTIKDITTGQIVDITAVMAAPATAPTVTATTAPSTMPAAAPVALAPAVAACDASDIPAAPEEPAAVARVGNPKVTHTVRGIQLLVPVTLKNVENINFTIHAYLTDTNGQALRDAEGLIDVRRDVHTGDEEDEDDYRVLIPAARMTSISLNTRVQIHVELENDQHRVVSRARAIQTTISN